MHPTPAAGLSKKSGENEQIVLSEQPGLIAASVPAPAFAPALPLSPFDFANGLSTTGLIPADDDR